MSRIEVTYRLGRSAAETLAEAEARARAIAFEQTVELPEALVSDRIRDEVVGRVLDVVTESFGVHRVRISYPAQLAAGQLPQLLNLVYGNASILPGVRLVGLHLPSDFLPAFPGPRWGVEGFREQLGVRSRPLLATAIKPRGLPVRDLAALAGAFAAGGGDIVKDDQNLNDERFEHFRERVASCAAAVDRANAQGGHCLYFPHVAASGEELDRRLEFVASLGLRGILAAPFLIGIDTLGAAAREHGLAWMAHPALTGSFTNPTDSGIAHGLLLGTLFRLAGADVSIFPNFGGRFSFTPEHCMEIAAALRAPLGGLAPAWPSPAGGMDLDRVPQMVRDYGRDSVLLIGGALLGHDADLERGTRAYVDAIEAAAHSLD